MLRKLGELHSFVKVQNLKCIYSFRTMNPGAQTARPAANFSVRCVRVTCGCCARECPEVPAETTSKICEV